MMRPTRTQSVSGRPLLRPPGGGAVGADAAELLAMDGAVSADVTAFVANDAARLPGLAGSAIVVDDFHIAAAAVVWVSAAVSGGRSCAGCRHGCNVSALRGLRSGMARVWRCILG